MDHSIEKVVRHCPTCLESTVWRKHLASHFNVRSKNVMLYPQHSYETYFFEVANSEVLMAIDLCTREVTFWWFPNRKRKCVANALISGLIIQRSVLISLRAENAPELRQEVVKDINKD